MQEFCHDRELVGRRQESPGLSGRGKRATRPGLLFERLSLKESVHIEYEEARGCKAGMHLGKTTGLREPG